MTIFTHVLASLVFVLVQSTTYAQQQEKTINVTPEQAGFASLEVQMGNQNIKYFVSTEGKPFDKKTKLPLVLYLHGSGPSPLMWNSNGRVSSSILYDASEFPGFHFAVISKPGIRFFEQTKHVASKEYDQNLSLGWRIAAANIVINELVESGSVDTSRVLVMGHSEGSDVAPWVAVENEHVTHVVALAPGGMSLMFDFVALVRRQIASGEISQQEGNEEIREIKEGFRKVFEDPTSTTKKWAGETHLRWSTFFRPALDAWRHVDKPVYIGICRDDRNTAVESGEAIELEFIRLRKKNLTSKLWPCDHYFVATNNNETTSGQEMRLEVLNDIFEWVKK